MLKVITTRYGQLVAKVNKEAGETQILNEEMEPVATIKRVTKEDVVKSINQIARFLSMKDVLEQLGIALAPGAYKLHSIDPDSFTDEDEATIEPEAKTEAMPTAETKPADAPVITYEEIQSQPRAVKAAVGGNGRKTKGAKRGRKPGSKVARNPALAW